MENISIEEHQRLMHDLHIRTRDSTYREMGVLVKEHNEQLFKWKLASFLFFLAAVVAYCL